MQALLAGRATARMPSLSQPGATLAARSPQPAPAQSLPAKRAEITHEGGETVQELAAGFAQGSNSHRNGLIEMAHFGYRLHEMDDWAATGFAGEEEFFSSHGLSASTWKTYLVLGERLSHLTLTQTRGISVSVARLITTINAKLWEEYAWVEEARLLSTKEFAQLAEKRLGGAMGRKGLAEPKAALSVSVPLRQREKFERRIDLVRKHNHLKTPAETLDYILGLAENAPALITSLEKMDQAGMELRRALEDQETMAVVQIAARMERCMKECKRFYAQVLTESPVEVTTISATGTSGT